MTNRRATVPERIAAAIIRSRLAVLALFAVLAVPAALFASRVRVDNSTDIWFSEKFDFLRRYREFVAEFGSDRFFVVSFTRGDLFTPASLETLSKTARSLESIEGVESVAGIHNAVVVDWTSGFPSPSPLMQGVPQDPEKCAKIRDRAMAMPLFADNLLSRDGNTAFLVGRISQLPLQGKRRLCADVESKLAIGRESGAEMHCAGIPFIEVEFDRLTRRENAIFIPVSVALIVVALSVLFRSARVLAATLATMGFSAAATIGAFTASGRAFCLVTSLIPPLILTVGIANAVHVMVRYREELGAAQSRQDALVRAVAATMKPCLFSSLTTAVGFLSLVVGDLPPVKEAGLFGALGIMIAFVSTFTAFPAAISLFPPRLAESSARGDRMDKVLLSIHAFVSRRRGLILAASAALFAVSGAGLLRLNSETEIIRYFRPDNKVRSDWEAIEGFGAGMITIEVLVRADKGAFSTTRAMEALDSMRKVVNGADGVHRSFSAIDVLDHASGAGQGAMPAKLRSFRWKLLLEAASGKGPLAGQLESHLGADRSTARIAARVFTAGAEMRLRMADSLLGELTSAFPGYAFEINGTAPLFSRIDGLIMHSQKRTAAVALAGIFVMTLLLLRSALLGLAAMFPNVLPITITLGFMGFAGIPVDVGTMIIAGVSIGIAVDDTIHYLARFGAEIARGALVAQALKATHSSVGRAMVFTSFILFLGFGVIGLSAFRPVYTFGLLTAMTMLLALAGDLFMLPAILSAGAGKLWMRRSGMRPPGA